jgi:hypothetical protein
MGQGTTKIWRRLSSATGSPGVVAVILWFTALVTLLAYGGIVAALMQAVAGLMAWTPAWVDARARGKRVLPDWGRGVVGIILFLASFGEYPAKQGIAAVTPQLGAASAKDPYASLAPVEREAIKQAEYYRAHPGEAVEVTGVKARKAGFGAVLLADITLHNLSPFDVKDFVITCISAGPSGTEVSRNTRTLYDVVKAGSVRTFMKFNMGFINRQSVRTDCRIDFATLA